MHMYYYLRSGCIWRPEPRGPVSSGRRASRHLQAVYAVEKGAVDIIKTSFVYAIANVNMNKSNFMTN